MIDGHGMSMGNGGDGDNAFRYSVCTPYRWMYLPTSLPMHVLYTPERHKVFLVVSLLINLSVNPHDGVNP